MKFDWAIDRLQDMLDEADQSFDIEALELAIKSIEAWEKVKKELIRTKDITEDRFDFGCCVMAIDSVLDIIDKHLSEVSE